MVTWLHRTVKEATAKSFWLRYSVRAAYRMGAASGILLTHRTDSGDAASFSPGYAAKIFSLYKAAAGVGRFYGRVAEVGAGDDCEIARLFLADGCDRVDIVDRFHGSGPQPLDAGMRRHRSPAERFFVDHRGYDFIVSCAVLEHAYDPLTALRTMAAALNPGGVMIHQVDCRDHGMFSDSFHELSFLRIPASIYAPMRWGGGPNRVLLGQYLNALASRDVKVYATTLAGVAEQLPDFTAIDQVPPAAMRQSLEFVTGVRDGLAREFRSRPVSELVVTSFLLVARPTETAPRQS